MSSGQQVVQDEWRRQGDGQVSAPALATCTVIVGLAAFAAVLIYVHTDPKIELDPAGFSVFAPIYIVAQALERLLEPWAARWKSTTQQKDALKIAREEKLAAQRQLATVRKEGESGEQEELELEAANGKEHMAVVALRKVRSERSVIWWCVATTLALLICGVLGLGLIDALATNELKEYVRAIDVVLTGIAIGAGTKPLHDLISRIEKSKTNADPATKPTAQLPGAPAAPSS